MTSCSQFDWALELVVTRFFISRIALEPDHRLIERLRVGMAVEASIDTASR